MTVEEKVKWAFYNARRRCRSSPTYISKGVQFRFKTVNDLIQELGPIPSPSVFPISYYTIDRIDNEGHYEKGNVRWATYTENAQNIDWTKTKRNISRCPIIPKEKEEESC